VPNDPSNDGGNLIPLTSTRRRVAGTRRFNTPIYHYPQFAHHIDATSPKVQPIVVACRCRLTPAVAHDSQ
jgi:hypothetical protein